MSWDSRLRITSRGESLGLFIKALKKQDAVTEFDEALWSSFINYVRVKSKGGMTFVFRDGSEVTVGIV